MKPEQETERLLKKIRLLVFFSDSSQRDLERRAGFSRGYLSQLLHGHVDIKLWQLLVILNAMHVHPSEFFAELFPQRWIAVPRWLRWPSVTREGTPGFELARLYGIGIESIEDLGRRLERCEAYLSELADLELVNGSWCPGPLADRDSR